MLLSARGRYKSLFEIQTYLRHQTKHKHRYNTVLYLTFYLEVTSEVTKSTVDIPAAGGLSVWPTEKTLQCVIKSPISVILAWSQSALQEDSGIPPIAELALSFWTTLAIMPQNLSVTNKDICQGGTRPFCHRQFSNQSSKHSFLLFSDFWDLPLLLWVMWHSCCQKNHFLLLKMWNI